MKTKTADGIFPMGFKPSWSDFLLSAHLKRISLQLLTFWGRNYFSLILAHPVYKM